MDGYLIMMIAAVVVVVGLQVYAHSYGRSRFANTMYHCASGILAGGFLIVVGYALDTHGNPENVPLPLVYIAGTALVIGCTTGVVHLVRSTSTRE